MRRIEEEWKDGWVLLLDMANPGTRQFAAEVGFEFTPTFILYDAQGNEVQRWRRPPDLGELP